jgi:hypothetical protein
MSISREIELFHALFKVEFVIVSVVKFFSVAGPINIQILRFSDLENMGQ